MAAITLRSVKGSALTNAEVDANFSNLNTELGQKLISANNLSDLSNAATARSNLGLGSVENKSSATIRSELTSSNVTTALGFAPYNATNPSGYITSSYTGFMLRTSSSQSNPNTNFSSSAYRFDPNANNPTNEHYAIVTYGNEINVVGQLATHFSTGQTFTRAYNTAWSSWRTLLDSSNYTSYTAGYVGAGSALRIATGNGYVDVGPMNSGYSHFQTDRPQFYFNKDVYVDGQIYKYNGGAYLHTGNYNSYSPTLTGTGASGTWGINVGGVSAGVSVYDTRSASTGPDAGQGVRFDFKSNSTDGLSDGGTYHGVMTFQQWSDASGGGTRQLGFTDNNNLWIRGSGSAVAAYDSWKKILDDANYSSYAMPLSGGAMTGNLRYVNLYPVGNTTYGIEGNNAFFDTINSGGSGDPLELVYVRGTSVKIGSGTYGSKPLYASELYQGGIRAADAWVHSLRDFTVGTIISTDIDYSQSSGDPWVLQLRGNSYGAYVPFDIQYQGYIYSNTIIHHGGVSNGTNITGMVALNVGGNLTFWFPRQAYWQGFEARVYSAYPSYARNRITSITDGAKPSGTKEVALSSEIRQSLHSGNYNSYALPLSGGTVSGYVYLSANGHGPNGSSTLRVSGDITIARDNGATGVIYLGNSGSAYLYWDGGAYYMPSGPLAINGHTALHAGNYNSYSPTLGGTGANGTWAINVTGSAGYASSAGAVPWAGISDKPSTIAGLIGVDASNADPVNRLGSGFYQRDTTTTANGWPLNSGWWHLHSTTHSNGANYYAMQFAADFYANNLYYRSTNGSGSTSWSRVLLSNNFSEYALPLGGGTLTGSVSISGNNKFTFGPNSGWGQYLQIGGSGIDGSYAQIAATNGNLHIESLGASYSIYLNHYRNGPVYIGSGPSLALHAGNYNSYSPTLTGGGASGSWGINVTGYANQIWNNYSGPATFYWSGQSGQPAWVYGSNVGSEIYVWNPANFSVNYANSSGAVSGLTLSNSGSSVNPDNVTQNQLGYNTSVSLFGQSDGGLYSSAYSSAWVHQIFGDFRTGQIAVRGKNSGTWQSWRAVLDATNYSSYALPLSGGTVSGQTRFTGNDNQVIIDGTTGGSASAAGLFFALQGALCWENYHYSGALRWYNYTNATEDFSINNSSSVANFRVTPTVGGSAVLHAGNYSGYALPLSGGTVSGYVYLSAGGQGPSSSSTLRVNGDITTARGNGTTGVIYLGNQSSVNSYVYWAGDAYYMPSGPLYSNGSAVLTAGNYSSYALPTSGGSLSGTIKVNTSGSSSATSHLIIKRSGASDPGSFGSYSGSWRSGIEIWNNDSTLMLFLNPPETGSAYGNIKSVGGGLLIGVGSSGATTALQFESDGSVANSIRSSAYGASSANSVYRMAMPRGASASWDGAVTGAIKIRLPVRNISSMWRMKVAVYNYSTNTLHEYHIGSYSYSTGGYNAGASCITTGNASPQTVRIGNDGTYDCVWIGETNTVWSYPVVSVTDFTSGYRGSADATWAGAWDISYVTSFGTVGETYTPSVNLASGSSVAGNAILHAGNWTSYVTGLPSKYPYQTSNWIADSTSAATLVGGDSNLTTVAMHNSHGYFGGWATTLTMTGYSQYGAYQISGSYNTSTPDLAVRNYVQSTGTWNSWVNLLSSSNYTNYSPSLSVSIWGDNASGASSTSATQNVYERAQYKCGFWDANGANWTPDGNWYWGATFAHRSNNSSYNYSGQLAFLNSGGGDSVYARTISNGSPTSWSRLLSSGNFSAYALPLSGGNLSGGIGRTDHHVGHLVGSYNSVGANSGKTNPIYTIGSSYNPTATSLSNMYGVGYSHSDFYGNNGGATGWGFYVASNGTIAAIIGTDGAWFRYNVTAYSDERLKTDWAPLAEDFVAKLAQVKVGSYTRIDNGERNVGVSAQSLRPVIPEAVIEGTDGMLSVAHGNAALASAVELAKEVMSLRAEIEAIKALIRSFK